MLLGNIVIGLSTKAEIRLKGLGGEALHGFVFNILKRASPEFASNLHHLGEPKPFCLSPLLEGHELKGGYSYIPTSGVVTFKLSLLTEELLTGAIAAFFNPMAEGEILSLSRKPVTVNSINMCPTDVDSFTSFDKLLTEAHPETMVTFEFLTPTSFRGDGIQTLFPEPRLVFSSLLRRWNTYSDVKIPEEYAETFPSIKVANYNLRTELIHFSTYKIIGFKGRVEYELPKDASEGFLRKANALADFASFSGVGVKTAMGMGQVRRIS